MLGMKEVERIADGPLEVVQKLTQVFESVSDVGTTGTTKAFDKARLCLAGEEFNAWFTQLRIDARNAEQILADASSIRQQLIEVDRLEQDLENQSVRRSKYPRESDIISPSSKPQSKRISRRVGLEELDGTNERCSRSKGASVVSLTSRQSELIDTPGFDEVELVGSIGKVSAQSSAANLDWIDFVEWDFVTDEQKDGIINALSSLSKLATKDQISYFRQAATKGKRDCFHLRVKNKAQNKTEFMKAKDCMFKSTHRDKTATHMYFWVRAIDPPKTGNDGNTRRYEPIIRKEE